MSKEVHSVSEEGFSTKNDIRDFEVTIDATGEEAPDTLESLLAAYSACYVPALRVGAEQRQAGDLGRIEIDVTGETNDDDKLSAIQFDVRTENDLDGKEDDVVERAEELCKVHDALKTDLSADVSVDAGSL